MRHVISNRNKTTWYNTDTRPTPEEFYEPGLNRQIAIREIGVEAFNDTMERLSQSEEWKHEEGTPEAITELKSLMRGHHIGNNSPGNLKFSGSSTERENSENADSRKKKITGIYENCEDKESDKRFCQSSKVWGELERAISRKGERSYCESKKVEVAG